MVASEIQTVALWWRLGDGQGPVCTPGSGSGGGCTLRWDQALTQETGTSQVSGFVVQIILARGA